MANITIADIAPSKESESFIKDLSDNELNLTYGGIQIIITNEKGERIEINI
ncbi:hypothetical protein [Moorena bouillonii]|uniref:hypothetical protein n=1 Tax=Moorena bouillonii TaxID=207920 RepID=UPI0013017547|nr:hypothetical protein [Moorena bouillonii]